VSFGQLTKELAQQAIGDQVKDMMETLRPPDLSSIAESVAGPKPAAPAQGDNSGAVIIAQVQAMQNALKEDQELVVLCTAGLETIRVLEFFAPSWRVAVLTGIDSDKVITRVVCPFESLQLVCKTLPVQLPAKPARIRFITPKPKAE
jgi:hypothetical protein